MQDKSSEGLRLLFLALLPGAIAAISPHPLIKLGAALATVAVVAKAGECFQAAAREAYWQLETAPEPRQLPYRS